MKSSARALAQKINYTRSDLLLPVPYKLFDKSLLHSPKTPELQHLIDKSPSLSGSDLFRLVAESRSHTYVQNLWDRLNDDQKQVFLDPPPTVHEHRVRIQYGYELSNKTSQELSTENPFYKTPLYPWEVIKDKLRHQPVFSSDVYDQLIQEAMAPARNLFKPDILYRNVCENFEPEKKHPPFSKLSSDQIEKYTAEAEKKEAYAQRRLEFQKAMKTHKNLDSFKKAYSQVIGDSMSEPTKSDFIYQQWDHKSSLNGPEKRKTHLKEMMLETRLEMVMDYIFNYNEVENCDVDWREWRYKVSGNLFYLDRILFPYIVTSDVREVELKSSLPSHLGWQGPVMD